MLSEKKLANLKASLVQNYDPLSDRQEVKLKTGKFGNFLQVTILPPIWEIKPEFTEHFWPSQLGHIVFF